MLVRFWVFAFHQAATARLHCSLKTVVGCRHEVSAALEEKEIVFLNLVQGRSTTLRDV